MRRALILVGALILLQPPALAAGSSGSAACRESAAATASRPARPAVGLKVDPPAAKPAPRRIPRVVDPSPMFLL